MKHQDNIEIFPPKIQSASRYVLVVFISSLLIMSHLSRGISMFFNNLGSIKLNHALLSHASEYTVNENFTRAGLKFQQALARDGNLGYAYYNLGIIYAHFGDEESAHDVFIKAYESSPADPVSTFQLGVVKAQSGDEEGAIALWQKVYAAPFFLNSTRTYKYMGDLDRALRDAQRAIAIDPSSLPGYHALGEIYYKQGAYSDALHAYQIALDVEPNNSISLYHVGQMYHHLEQIEKAITYYQRAIMQDPQYKPALMNLAEIYSKQANCEQAEAVLHQLLYAQRGTLPTAKALRIVGSCYLTRHNPDEALLFLEQLAILETANNTDYYLLAQAYEVLERFDDAIVVYDYILRLDPDYEHAQTALSRLTKQ